MRVQRVLLIAASVLLAAASLGRACTTDPECNDGNPCNGAETCQAGTCYPGYPAVCGNYPGTISWCDPLTGCRYQIVTSFRSCDDPTQAAFAWAEAKTQCPCDAVQPHGQYVRCVAHAVMEASAGTVPRNCRAAVKRCAARSTCGRASGFVTCCFARRGSCDGSLCQDGVTPCSGGEDCPPRDRCTVRASAAACIARGGSPGGGSCCDLLCGLP